MPGVASAESYLFYLYRTNRRPNTLKVNFSCLKLFLQFLKAEAEALCHLEGLERKHLEAFIEHQQDRGLKPATVKERLSCVRAFLRFLMEEGVVRHEVLARPIAVKVPDSLPRAIAPEDVRRLLSVIDSTRNRAMVLLLLRTGMRIGEVLSLRLQDIDLADQRIVVVESNKTLLGRLVYFSSDAKEALLAWLKEMDPRPPQGRKCAHAPGQKRRLVGCPGANPAQRLWRFYFHLLPEVVFERESYGIAINEEQDI